MLLTVTVGTSFLSQLQLKVSYCAMQIVNCWERPRPGGTVSRPDIIAERRL